MSAPDRALARLARPGACCAPDPRGAGWAVFADRDLRRRAVARFAAGQARIWLSDGAIAPDDASRWVLTDAGRALAARLAAGPDTAFRAQHRAADDGAFADGPMARLARLREADGRASFTAIQLAAGARLHLDWLATGAALIATSDWSRAPGGAGAGDRGSQARAAARLDALARVRRLLDAVGADHAAVLEATCLRLVSFQALERETGAPRGSTKARTRAALQALAVAAGLTLR